MTRLIKRGAEADILLGKWKDIQAIFKVRKSREYMHPELDELLRSQRTLREAELIKEAKDNGVRCPRLYFVNLEDSTIIMEYVKGPRLKDVSDKENTNLFGIMGNLLGKLHKSGIIHGDPTTSNFILFGDELVVLDFGLSFRSNTIEDRAVDLHLVKEVLSGDDPFEFRQKYAKFLEGYRVGFGTASDEIIGRVKQIEKRGRYARSSWGE